MRGRTVFLYVFAAALAVQSLLWFVCEGDFADRGAWIDAAERIAAGQTLAPDHIAFGYPGTTLTYPAALLVGLGFGGLDAYRFVLAIAISIIAAASAALAYRLRPESPWWWGMSGLIALSHLPFIATPPSSLVGPLIAALMVAALWCYEHPRLRSFALLGLVAGLVLATRFDISALIFASTVLFLGFFHGWRVLVSLPAAALAFYAAVPPLWSGGEYVAAVYEKISEHTTFVISPFLGELLLDAPLAFLSFAALGALILSQRFDILPRPFALWLAGTLMFVAAVLLTLPYHPLWYFHPLLMVGEAFLPLLMAAVWRQSNGAASGVVGLLVCLQAVLLFLFFLPL